MSLAVLIKGHVQAALSDRLLLKRGGHLSAHALHLFVQHAVLFLQVFDSLPLFLQLHLRTSSATGLNNALD